jgi:hypothetical protein
VCCVEIRLDIFRPDVGTIADAARLKARATRLIEKVLGLGYSL